MLSSHFFLTSACCSRLSKSSNAGMPANSKLTDGSYSLESPLPLRLFLLVLFLFQVPVYHEYTTFKLDLTYIGPGPRQPQHLPVILTRYFKLTKEALVHQPRLVSSPQESRSAPQTSLKSVAGAPRATHHRLARRRAPRRGSRWRPTDGARYAAADVLQKLQSAFCHFSASLCAEQG